MSTDYVLGRDVMGSIRLDAQHLLWKLHHDYLIHPSIHISDDFRIAELGCGTGIWLLDLSTQVPPTVKLDGFDLSDRQYPPRTLWPPNLELSTLDSLKEPPASLKGQFDVVHLRMWASNITSTTLPTLVQNINMMLKPGGFLLWEEADLTRQVVQGDDAKMFEEKLNQIFQASKLDYSWVGKLPSVLHEEGLELIQFQQQVFKPQLVQLGTNTYLLALAEILKGIRARLGETHELNDPCKQHLHRLLDDNTSGTIYNWGPTSVLAQKQ